MEELYEIFDGNDEYTLIENDAKYKELFKYIGYQLFETRNVITEYNLKAFLSQIKHCRLFLAEDPWDIFFDVDKNHPDVLPFNPDDFTEINRQLDGAYGFYYTFSPIGISDESILNELESFQGELTIYVYPDKKYLTDAYYIADNSFPGEWPTKEIVQKMDEGYKLYARKFKRI